MTTTDHPPQAPRDAPGRVDELLPLVASLAAEKDAVEARYRAAKGRLLAAALWVRDVTGTLPTLRHEGRAAVLVQPAPGLVVRDEDAYRDWAVTNHEGVPTVVDPVWRKRHLEDWCDVVVTAEGAAVFDRATGEEVPGVVVTEPGQPWLQVRKGRA